MNNKADLRLLETLPDLVMEVSRDGTIRNYGGGRAMTLFAPSPAAIGQRLEAVCPAVPATLLKRLIGKAIASRTPVEVGFSDAGRHYHARVLPQGLDRAVCVLRLEPPPQDFAATDVAPTGSHRRPYLDRRGFLRQFEEAFALSALTEKPLAVVAIVLDGVDEIARFDPKMAERAVTSALLRLPQTVSSESMALCECVGQLSDNQLIVAATSALQQSIERLASEIQGSLAEPLHIDTTSFQLSSYAGIAVMGRDAVSASELLANARIAMHDARRATAARPVCFSDAMKLTSTNRLDIATELRNAIDASAIRHRYIGRYDLATGRLVTLLSYVRWSHPLRGDIAPADFLAAADATGMAIPLSRAILSSLQNDFRLLEPMLPHDTRVSYGPLRQHLLHVDFLSGLLHQIAQGPLPAERLEIRIAEGTLVALPLMVCDRLRAQGIQIVVDEVGRGMGSLDRLARAPLWGMQLDRAWVATIRDDELARRVCQAGIAAALALGIAPVATGVDDERQRQILLALGCPYGSGDLYAWSWASPPGAPL